MFFIIGAYANIRGTILHWPQAFVRASKYVALFALLLLPFFEPVGLRHVISSIFGTKYLVMQVVAIAVIAVLYVFRTPRDKFGLLVVAIVSFILLTMAANERMRRLRIYAKWLYD